MRCGWERVSLSCRIAGSVLIPDLKRHDGLGGAADEGACEVDV